MPTKLKTTMEIFTITQAKHALKKKKKSLSQQLSMYEYQKGTYK